MNRVPTEVCSRQRFHTMLRLGCVTLDWGWMRGERASRHARFWYSLECGDRMDPRLCGGQEVVTLEDA